MSSQNLDNWHIIQHENFFKNFPSHTYNENQDDDIGNGLLPKIWGPPTWKSLHSITFAYPNNPTKEDKKHYRIFFEMLAYVLPCKSCRMSYAEFIKTDETKITNEVFKNRRNLTKWLYDVHERVNKKIGVSYNITYEDLVETYESFKAKCSKQNDKCIASSNKAETNAFINEYKVDCNVIPYSVAKCFVDYGKKRGVTDFDDIDKYENIDLIKKTELWNKRNNECYAIIRYMRENSIGSIEDEGPYKGLPTIEELKLISRISSNLHFNELQTILKNMGYSLEKKYKFVI